MTASPKNVKYGVLALVSVFFAVAACSSEGIDVKLLEDEERRVFSAKESGVEDPERGAIRAVYVFDASDCNLHVGTTEKLNAQLADDGKQMVAIIRSSSRKEARRYLSVFQKPFPVLIDSTGWSKDVIGYETTPTLVTLDSTRVVRERHQGVIRWPKILESI